MSAHFDIELLNIAIHANHGVFEQEQTVGNEFKVNLKVSVEDRLSVEKDDLNDSLSYAELYEIIKDSMTSPRRLLESVAKEIAIQICDKWEIVTSVEVSVEKQVPPMSGIEGQARVKYFLKK